MVLKVNDWLRIIPGFLVALSGVFAYFHSMYWLLLTLFVGINLFQFGFTGFCPLEMILKKLGIEE